MILIRTIQLKNLIQVHQPMATYHQEKQKEQQDLSNNILNQQLGKETTFYVKIEGLIENLEPRFRGPYTVYVTKR